ncbi:MAG: DNA alkylation repair protein [Planctomycetes bacterium]|jgi:3-methyladenine DNA glycosylase AlkD|nr:DNA alkylation repair protein [Planctomycetota bacterium]MCL4730193.1 DNA alkylation repair protein [Planctomycetota bacterium]
MSVRNLADEIIAALRAAAKPGRVKAAENYHPTRQEVLGLYAADMRAVLAVYRARLKSRPGREVIGLARQLAARDILDARSLAYELVAGHRAAMAGLTRADLLALARGIDNWRSVDEFACALGGVKWRDGVLGDTDITRWAQSRDLWLRRAAVVCTVPLNLKARGGTGDSRRTLMVCELAAADGKIMVQKALSWALRELSRRDRRGVELFLKRHNAVLGALVKREVLRKLRTGKKNG